MRALSRAQAADRLLAWGAVGAGGMLLESADLVGHRGGELVAPASPGEGFVVETDPLVVEDLDRLIDPATRGDPE